jgi:hypothetical protein
LGRKEDFFAALLTMTTRQRQLRKQPQRRNAGVSPLRRQSAPPSVEMTISFFIVLKKTLKQAEL